MSLRIPVPTPTRDVDAYFRNGWWRDQSLRSGLEHVADNDPERVAVVDNAGCYTYGELRDRVHRAVATLLDVGLRAGDTVLLVAPNRCTSIVAFAAILRASGVVVALDRKSGLVDVTNAAEAARPTVVVAPDEVRSPLALSKLKVPVCDIDALSVDQPRHAEFNEPDWFAPRIILFTSGTTSRPKGVVHNLHSFSAGVDNLAQAFNWTTADTPFLCSPLASITGLSQVQMSLRGGRIVLEDDFHPARTVDLLEGSGATILGGPPVILENLFTEYAQRRQSATSLRSIALGGTMIPPSVVTDAVHRFRLRVVRVYGSSEAPTHTASGAAGHLGDIPGDEGLPLGGGTVQIGSPEVNDEILVRGPNLFQGYLRPDDNIGAFVNSWFCTGDLGEVDALTGHLSIRGRRKEIAARKGVKISLAEIDDALRGFPGLLEGAAFVLPDPETGERVAVALRMEPGKHATYDDLSRFLRTVGVATVKLPEQVDSWSIALPRTASGKIQRQSLSSPPGDVQSELAPRLRSAE